ncbi:hypothetical protein [Oryzobacter telluris]|uniref:hypothetical protein n=1 Tax=Oryzobacter telluris TaxID=3149179 RepID=UPI00370D81F2
MSPPLRPLPGDPGAVRHLAGSLRATGERLGAIAATLARLRDGAVWEGSAGEAFGARVGDVPPVLTAVAERFVGAVPPLLALATVLEEVQPVIGAAVHDDDAATVAYAALEDRVVGLVASGSTEDDPAVLVLRHLQREQVEVQVRARGRHAAAVGRFREVDARAAASLRALTFDDLGDSVVYRAVATVSGTGRGLASLGALAPVAPELLPVALVGDAAASVSDAALYAAYGEGSAGALATDAALWATAGVGRVLRYGSVVGAEATATGARTTQVLTRQQRVAQGAVETVRARRDALRSAFAGVPARGTPSALIGGPATRSPRLPDGATVAERASAAARAAAERAREAAADQVRRRVLDDWRLASANGASAQKMYATGVTLEVAGTAGTRAVEHQRDDRAAGGR